MGRLIKTIEIKPGDYTGHVEAKIEEFGSKSVVRRIWEKDASLWLPCGKSKHIEREIKERLGWLDLPFTMASKVQEIINEAYQLRNQGFRHIVLLGMGGSSLAAHVFASLASEFGLGDPKMDFHLLDSTHPVEINRVESSVDIERTIFIVSSKSGTTQETVCLFDYFFDKIRRTIKKPTTHFITITDPDTPLHRRSQDLGFEHIFLAPADVGGRFSALSHFGLVPAALLGIDIVKLISEAKRAAEECALETKENPALLIAATISALYEQGIDKINFITDAMTSPFADWLEQLIAESTGKDGKGILPIIGEPFDKEIRYAKPRLFVTMQLKSGGGQIRCGEDQIQSLLESGRNPILSIRIEDPIGIAAQMFLWEFAVAAICSQLGVNAFDQPDVQLAKDLARKAIDGEIETCDDNGEKLLECKRIVELKPHIAKFLSPTNPDDYFAIQAFVPKSNQLLSDVDEIRLEVLKRYGIATTFGFGPRFLHSTGQLHKGGPANGIFLQIVDRPKIHLAIPNTNMSFAKLIAAQALGDYLALKRLGRRIIRASMV